MRRTFKDCEGALNQKSHSSQRAKGRDQMSKRRRSGRRYVYFERLTRLDIKVWSPSLASFKNGQFLEMSEEVSYSLLLLLPRYKMFQM